LYADIPAANYTVSFWLKATDQNSGIFDVDVGAIGKSKGNDRHIYLSSGKFCQRVWSQDTKNKSNDGSVQYISCTDSALSNEFNLITLVVTDTSISHYVNGVLSKKIDSHSSEFDWRDRFFLGFSYDGGSDYLTGTLDEFYYYNRALTDAEVTDLYNGEPQQQATENQPIYSLFQPLDNIYAALDSAEQMSGMVLGQCTYGGYCNRTALSSAHNGVDYMVAKGTPVYAICDGTVKVAAKGGALANRFTVIDHSGCGEFAKLFGYYGQIEPMVKVGDKVESGDQIGVVSDGKTNSHLQLSLNSSYLKEYGYSNVKKSTAKDCKKDTVMARRKLLDAKGWIDPITVAMGAGWNPALLKGGSKDCNATEQLYTDKSLPYSPWK